MFIRLHVRVLLPVQELSNLRGWVLNTGVRVGWTSGPKVRWGGLKFNGYFSSAATSARMRYTQVVPIPNCHVHSHLADNFCSEYEYVIHLPRWRFSSSWNGNICPTNYVHDYWAQDGISGHHGYLVSWQTMTRGFCPGLKIVGVLCFEKILDREVWLPRSWECNLNSCGGGFWVLLEYGFVKANWWKWTGLRSNAGSGRAEQESYP